MNAFDAGQNAAIKAFNQSQSKPDWKYFDDAKIPQVSVSVNDRLISDEIEEVMYNEFMRGFNECLSELERDYNEYLAELGEGHPV